jgi:hypothetical protein
MNNGGFSATASATIFEDCVILAAGYGNISFNHCNREANEVPLLDIASMIMLIKYGILIPLVACSLNLLIM